MEPRDAATLLLVRDADPPAAHRPGIEVFMLRRNLRSAFVAGAHVFPGGAVDLEDRASSTFWIAAIRETGAGLLAALDDAWHRPSDAMRFVSTNGWQVPLPGDGIDGPALEADARAHSVTGRAREAG